MTALLGIPAVLLVLPADFFDKGETFCPSKRFFHTECPGCGITRSVMHFIHLEFKRAWEYNKLILIVVPVFGYYWIKWIRNAYLTLRH